VFPPKGNKFVKF